MPAEQGQGGGKVLAVVGGAVLVGVLIGAGCVIAKGGGSPDTAGHSVNKEHASLQHATLQHRAERRSPLVVETTRAPLLEHARAEREARSERRSEPHNETHNETHNESAPEHKHHGHHHKRCSGGPRAACECMLACSVFGGNTSRCEGHDHNATRELVDGLILKTMLSHSNMCEGMRCIKECAKELGCLDKKVMEDCEIVEENYAENKFDDDPECKLDCRN